MVYSEPHQYVTFIGDGWAGTEIWQFGLRLRGGLVTPTDAQMAALATAGANLIKQNGACQFTNRIRLTSVKHARIDVDGKYFPAFDAEEYFLPTPAVGMSTTAHLLPQSTHVVSLTTDRNRGFASRGRIFPPPQSLNLDPDGRVPAATAEFQRDLYKSFFQAVNAVGIGTIGIFSAVGQGTTRTVTGVRVGRVVDTQRRRRSALAEEHVTAPL